MCRGRAPDAPSRRWPASQSLPIRVPCAPARAGRCRCCHSWPARTSSGHPSPARAPRRCGGWRARSAAAPSAPAHSGCAGRRGWPSASLPAPAGTRWCAPAGRSRRRAPAARSGCRARRRRRGARSRRRRSSPPATWGAADRWPGCGRSTGCWSCHFTVLARYDSKLLCTSDFLYRIMILTDFATGEIHVRTNGGDRPQ